MHEPFPGGGLGLLNTLEAMGSEVTLLGYSAVAAPGRFRDQFSPRPFVQFAPNNSIEGPRSARIVFDTFSAWRMTRRMFLPVIFLMSSSL